jgi:hypothetical protein
MGVIMRILKLIIASILVLFLVLTFLFALFPSKIRIARVIEIPASREKTMAVINDLGSWQKWNLFVNDSILTNTYLSSPARGIGAFLKSDQFQVTITENSADSLQTAWTKAGGKRFSGEFVVLSSGPGNCIVQWYFDFSFSWYPWEKLGSMFYDKQIGPIMEKSLNGLRVYLEKIP